MAEADLHPDEGARLAALHAYGVLDTAPEAAFDGVVRLAARLCAAPTALVSLIDRDRQWFKARVGLHAEETPRDRAICGHAILFEHDAMLVVPDTHADPRTADNPLCTGDPNIRFYAGVPIRTPDGLPLGTLCVIDSVPRPGGLSEEQTDSLRVLGAQVETVLEAKRQAAREAVLRREAIHRGKNVVGIVQAVASQTLRRARSLDEADSTLRARLAAMGAAYDLLRGGGDEVDLGELVARQLHAFTAGADGAPVEPGRIDAAGPPLRLGARAAEGIGLALHELATNAVKHGALGPRGGRVAVAWARTADGGGEITWTEADGPPPRADGPSGFGSLVVQQLAARATGGAATLTLAPGGAHWHARIAPEALAAVAAGD